MQPTGSIAMWRRDGRLVDCLDTGHPTDGVVGSSEDVPARGRESSQWEYRPMDVWALRL
jgi:hypothetical protein